MEKNKSTSSHFLEPIEEEFQNIGKSNSSISRLLIKSVNPDSVIYFKYFKNIPDFISQDNELEFHLKKRLIFNNQEEVIYIKLEKFIDLVLDAKRNFRNLLLYSYMKYTNEYEIFKIFLAKIRQTMPVNMSPTE